MLQGGFGFGSFEEGSGEILGHFMVLKIHERTAFEWLWGDMTIR